MKTYITHIAANTTHGIFCLDPVDYPDAEWISFGSFRNSLRTLDDGETIFCAVDPDEMEILQNEYGVKA